MGEPGEVGVSVPGEGHVGPGTVSEVLALPEDAGNRIELVGALWWSVPVPASPTSAPPRRLAALLRAAGGASGQPLEVLEAVNMVIPGGMLIPDIGVADADATAAAVLSIDAHDVVLVMEIALPSTRVTGREMEPALYAAAGIPHYWRLELVPAARLYCGTRHGSSGYMDRALTAGQSTELSVPLPVALDPAHLL
ncbi:Uma2 family endonuclease [Streptomyces sp. NPDC007971]|uniref:Uma2 family endonuclease n=1 Tax=Streptomyces sp. NPDC007971 TaxID=3364799 RepID=UPI0036E47EEB